MKIEGTFKFLYSFTILFPSQYLVQSINLSDYLRSYKKHKVLQYIVHIVYFTPNSLSLHRIFPMAEMTSFWSIFFPALILIAWLPIIITTVKIGRNKSGTSNIKGNKHYIILFLFVLMNIAFIIIGTMFPSLSKTMVFQIIVG